MRHPPPFHWKPFALFLAALVFLCLPAIFSFAGADTLSTSDRSNAAVERTLPQMTRDVDRAGFHIGAPVYLQINKSEATLSAYLERSDGTYMHFRTWPVCAASGTLGPKQKQGDGQAPEGFYTVAPRQMNPASSYHLSFNLGYPNAYDRARGYTGDYLMVHGNCVSIGCYAMTDAGIDEIWTLMQAAFEGGQTSIPVHIFPFDMTAANLQANAGSEHAAFWRSLAPAWVHFETTALVPEVLVSNGDYALADVVH